MMKKAGLLALIMVSFSGLLAADEAGFQSFLQAERNGWQAQQAFLHCDRYLQGWLHHREPQSGLIPRNLTRNWFWNAQDAAADNYPFMVLTAALLNESLFRTTMLEMLDAETILTSRLDHLPDDYDFATQNFRTREIDLDHLIFGGSEYIKDGLIPLTEWLGESPWSERMLNIMQSIWEHAPVETDYGRIPSTSHEINGEQLQTLNRLYWMTGNEKYRTWAFRLADYYFAEHNPVEAEQLRLRDHGCEVISGLAEVYFLAYHTDKERYQKYQKPMHRILDRILEVGTNEDGLFYDIINPKTGEKISNRISDNWGYNYNAFLNVYQLDGKEEYRQAVERILGNIIKYVNFSWEGNSADGYADAIEGGLNLLNRIPVDKGFQWVDESMKILLNMQRPDGIIEGWHGDGNFARTALMYALWKTRGVHVSPWNGGLAFGAEQYGDELFLSLRSDWNWQGFLLFDIPRHQFNLHLPSDYPRINQFPEWFTVEPEAAYEITINAQETLTRSGRQLHEGFALAVQPDHPIYLHIRKID
ncbi:MAG: hypothetical protein ACOX5R_01725 [bacterium]